MVYSASTEPKLTEDQYVNANLATPVKDVIFQFVRTIVCKGTAVLQQKVNLNAGKIITITYITLLIIALLNFNSSNMQFTQYICIF